MISLIMNVYKLQYKDAAVSYVQENLDLKGWNSPMEINWLHALMCSKLVSSLKQFLIAEHISHSIFIY